MIHRFDAFVDEPAVMLKGEGADVILGERSFDMESAGGALLSEVWPLHGARVISGCPRERGLHPIQCKRERGAYLVLVKGASARVPQALDTFDVCTLRHCALRSLLLKEDVEEGSMTRFEETIRLSDTLCAHAQSHEPQWAAGCRVRRVF